MIKFKDCFRNWTSRPKWVLDPGGDVVMIWNRIFLVSCVASHCIDPLFFFLPIVESRYPQLCMSMDHHLAIVLTYLRSVIDVFFIVHIATRFCTAYVNPGSKVLGKGELPKKVANRYIRTKFFVHLLAALPVPQVLVWAVMPSMSLKHIDTLLFLIILAQSAIRLYIMILVSINIMKTEGFIAKNEWEGTIYNLVLYLVASHGVEEDSILRQLPADLRRDIKQCLCLDLVQRVPFFSAMDQQLLDAICERMTYFLCTEGTYIVHEGDPVRVMHFIICDKLESSTTEGGRDDFFNSIILKPGDFCGDELLTWALLPSSSGSYPSSTRTVKTVAELEAFSLQADDMKFVASTFRMMHSGHLQHTFRFHSYQWRTWAARFIQSAWRRHQNRQKITEGLSSRWESFFPFVNDLNETRCEHVNGSFTSVSQGATVTVSKIASIFRKAQQERPEEPDFSADDHPE